MPSEKTSLDDFLRSVSGQGLVPSLIENLKSSFKAGPPSMTREEVVDIGLGFAGGGIAKGVSSKVFARGTQLKLSEGAKDAFTSLADAQRGAPEIIMTQIQSKIGGGPLSFLVEHVGDLTHRMSNLAKFGSAGIDDVAPKVRSALRVLRNRADRPGITKQIEPARRELTAYAQAHSELKVFNRPQFLAREAAVALGRKNFTRAENMLTQLETLLKNPAQFERAALTFNPNVVK